MRSYNQQEALIYHTFQLYRTDRLTYLKKLLDHAKSRGYIIGAKLVRGAYMEKERLRAEKLAYPSPIHRSKESTDKDFNTALQLYPSYSKNLAIFAGTHNEESTELLTKIIAENDPENKNSIVSLLFPL